MVTEFFETMRRWAPAALLATLVATEPVSAASWLQQTRTRTEPVARPPGWLGLNVELRQEFEAGRVLDSEMIVEMVQPGSGAERAGLKAGDVLVRVGDTPGPGNALMRVLSALSFELYAGDLVPVTVRRDGELLEFAIEAGVRPTVSRADPTAAPRVAPETRVFVFTPPASRQATWRALRRSSDAAEPGGSERTIQVSTQGGRTVQIVVDSDSEEATAWSYTVSGTGDQRHYVFYNPDAEALLSGIDVLRMEVEELSRNSNRRSLPTLLRWLRGDRAGVGSRGEDAQVVIARAEARIKEMENQLAEVALERIGPTPDSVVTVAVGATRPITPYAYFGRRYLAGAYLVPLNEGMREYFGVNRGALILDSVEGAPALEAGLLPGDVVVAVGGVDITDPDALQMELSRSRPPFDLTVVRRGQRLTIRLP